MQAKLRKTVVNSWAIGQLVCICLQNSFSKVVYNLKHVIQIISSVNFCSIVFNILYASSITTVTTNLNKERSKQLCSSDFMVRLIVSSNRSGKWNLLFHFMFQNQCYLNLLNVTAVCNDVAITDNQLYITEKLLRQSPVSIFKMWMFNTLSSSSMFVLMFGGIEDNSSPQIKVMYSIQCFNLCQPDSYLDVVTP